MRRAGAKKRRDASEAAIVAALRAFGATVIHLSGAAPVPDLLVGWRGRWVPMEVKSGAKAGFTPMQLESMANGTMQPAVVRSIKDALTAMGATR